ncbi:uncharacterized protein LOC129572634 isoform X2 [Sitodiplosis mosellana]|uniref:uncharacterized protein LOC129572634 isoform X2 n=1 Tax=Sitodiplosis mosellana TaxID=263140 RepID=UPI0024452C87|nr:uncharacterized protein LOC129572634 isoform X2 [Sitodiplosis mosellana]
MTKIKCKIADIIENPAKKQKRNPVIVQFQNGSLSNEFASGLDVCIAKDIQNENTSSLLLALSKDNVYDGLIDRNPSCNLKKTFIGVRKKTSEEVKLVEVTECSMMSHIYRHNNICYTQNLNSSNEHSHMSSESARRILFKDFGGKKAIKVLDRKEKMKVNVDAVKEQLDKTLLDISQNHIVKKDEFDRGKEEQDHILQELVPKMNADATKLIDVYNLNELIDVDILESLNDAALKVLGTSSQDLPIKPTFLSNIIKWVQQARFPEDIDNLKRVKACIYIDALLNYFKQVNQVHQNSNIKLKPISQVTSKLDSHIKKKFSQPNINKPTKTNYVVHKTCCYIIVLSLLVSDRYEMDIQNIVEETGISKTNLFKMMNSIAVRPKAKSSIISIRMPSQLKSFATNFRRRRTL